MNSEELIRYKVQKMLSDFRNKEELIFQFILDLSSGVKSIADIKAEVIADKQIQLDNIEVTKTALTADLVDLNK